MAGPATSFQLNWLNRWYLKLDNYHAASIKGSPWLKRVKFGKRGGESVVSRFTLYGHRSSSGDIATAQGIAANNRGGSRKLAWNVTYGEYSGSILVPHRDQELSRQDDDAAAKALTFEVGLALKQHGNELTRIWFSNPGYSLVSAARAVAAGVITLGNAQEASNFYPGDQIVVSANNGSSSAHVLVAGSGVGYVISRDLRAGTVTVSTTPGGAAGTPVNWGATNFYFRQGEFLPGGTDIMTPLQAYLPQAPATSILNGVDRSLDSILSGFIPAAASLTGKTGSARVKRTINEHREQLGEMSETSEMDCAYINPVDWGKMEEEYGAKGMTVPYGDTAKDGYSSLVIQTANGELRLISEPQCPRGRCFLLAQNDITWHTPSGMIGKFVDMGNGSIFRVKDTSNDLEMRPQSYIAATMGAPYKHAHIDMVG